jgi:hypothetical protein
MADSVVTAAHAPPDVKPIRAGDPVLRYHRTSRETAREILADGFRDVEDPERRLGPGAGVARLDPPTAGHPFCGV